MNFDIQTVAEFGLGIQAWAGEGKPEPSRLGQLNRTARPDPKPQEDGFFTSSWDQTRRSSPWVLLMQGEQKRSGTGRQLWLLEPNPHATLYVIDREPDYERLARNYPQRWSQPSVSHSRPPAPDWHQLSGEIPFDGVHVTERASALIQGWDVESTLWLRWQFIGESTCDADIRDDWTLEYF